MIASTRMSFIAFPQITAPLQGETGFTSAITATVDENPNQVQWQLALDSAFTQPVTLILVTLIS